MIVFFKIYKILNAPGIIIIIHIRHEVDVLPHIFWLVSEAFEAKFEYFEGEVFVLGAEVLHPGGGDEHVELFLR